MPNEEVKMFILYYPHPSLRSWDDYHAAKMGRPSWFQRAFMNALKNDEEEKEYETFTVPMR